MIASRVGDAVSTAALRVLWKEDWESAHRSWGRPGLHALMVYRLGHWALTQPQPMRLAATVVFKILNNLVIRNIYGVEISAEASIGRGVAIGHHQAVQIPAFCVIGDRTLIRHNVTIGFAGSDAPREAVPHIGRDVELGSGCVLMGPITIGHGAKIGPNAVVMTNVPDGASVFTPPARIMKAQPSKSPPVTEPTPSPPPTNGGASKVAI